MIRIGIILGNLGRLVLIAGIAMLSCLIWSIAYQESVTVPILQAAALTIACGLLLKAFYTPDVNVNFKEGFVIVSLGWIVVSLFGTLPYLFSGYMASFTDAFFETVSGFTTTGASVIPDVEAWPHGLLFWRSLTQWLGGMGIISLFIAVIANLGTRAKQLFKSELPGVASDNVSPRIRETARRLWITYVVLSACCTIVFYLLGMDFFDSLCHAFGTLSTSGFSTKNASIAYYASPQLEWAIIFFMFISGINFALHFFSFRNRSPRAYWKNAEFKFYTGIILVISLLVFLTLGGPWQGANWGDNLRIALFHVTSIVTTTGYAAADNNLWSHMGTALILIMMFIGGCSGSTAGGVKPGRYLIILQRSIIEFKKMVHPRAVYSLRYGERVIKNDLLLNVLQFFFLYIIILSVSMLYLTTQGLDILSSLTAAAACMGTTGSGMGIVGPIQNFSEISGGGKYVLCALMLIGRLEIYPLLVLFIPTFWQE